MTIKVTKPIKCFSPDAAILAGSFVPNGTSDPTSDTELGDGVATVTYNAATGKWLVTINVPISAIVALFASAEDNAAQTVSFEVRAAVHTDSAQTFEIWAQSSTDVSGTNYAATNTIDRINWLAIVNLSDQPGNGT
jgi:hypothetical protein